MVFFPMVSTPTSKLILGIGVAVLSLVAAVVAALVAAGDEETPANEDVGRFVEPEENPLFESGAAVGKPVPQTTFELLDGTTSSLDAYEGTPLVLNFFGSWCPPCVAEMPAIERIHQEFGDRVAFLGLAIRDTASDAKAIVEDTGVTYETGRDRRGNIFTEIGAVQMPSTVFISAEGEVLDIHGGELSGDELGRKITELLIR